VPYAIQLSAGASSRQRWHALDVPPGLTFDDEQLTLSGTPTVAGTLLLLARDGAGKPLRETTIAIEPRASCWLATSQAAALTLFDRVLGSTVTLVVDAAAGESISDFAFSPDGRFLVLRTRKASGDAISFM
jgi:hypothetical protein